MSRCRYAVIVRRVPGPRLLGRQLPSFWIATCPVDHMQAGARLGSLTHAGSLESCQKWATKHAATCDALHWANWEAACPSCCKAYGVIAPACPTCQGYGWVKESAA